MWKRYESENVHESFIHLKIWQCDSLKLLQTGREHASNSNWVCEWTSWSGLYLLWGMKMDTHEQWTQRLPSSHVPSIPGSTKDCVRLTKYLFSNVFIFILSWQFGSEENVCEASAVCRRLWTSGGKNNVIATISKNLIKTLFQSSGWCQLTFSVSLCLRALQ